MPNPAQMSGRFLSMILVPNREAVEAARRLEEAGAKRLEQTQGLEVAEGPEETEGLEEAAGLENTEVSEEAAEAESAAGDSNA